MASTIVLSSVKAIISKWMLWHMCINLLAVSDGATMPIKTERKQISYRLNNGPIPMDSNHIKVGVVASVYQLTGYYRWDNKSKQQRENKLVIVSTMVLSSSTAIISK